MSKISYQNYLLMLLEMALVLIGVFVIKIKNYATKKLLKINVGDCYTNNKFYTFKTVLKSSSTGVFV